MEEYIKDNGRVRLCPSNIAKMNIFESMYYHRFRMWENIVDVTGDLIENLYLIRELFILLILPLAYPYMAWWEVRKAQKVMINREVVRSESLNQDKDSVMCAADKLGGNK